MSAVDNLTDYAAAKEMAYRRQAHPKGWEPGVVFESSGAKLVTTSGIPQLNEDEGAWIAAIEDMGLRVPEGYSVRMVSASFDPVAWTRDSVDQKLATTKPVWRYKFAIEPGVSYGLDRLHEEMKRWRPRTSSSKAGGGSGTFVTALGDIQAGKTDGDGWEGTAKRFFVVTEQGLQRYLSLRKRKECSDSILAPWLGDCVEGFRSQGGANAWRVSLTMTEQIRAVRRMMLTQVKSLAPHCSELTLPSVPGNHDETERTAGKMSTRYDDSWAVEAAIGVADAIADLEHLAHVRIVLPAKDELCITLESSNTIVGMAHGHQFGSDPLKWWDEQAGGRQPIGDADILLAGHLHTAWFKHNGPKTFFQVQALESESTWWRHKRGKVSPPGATSMVVEDGGWRDLALLSGVDKIDQPA